MGTGILLWLAWKFNGVAPQTQHDSCGQIVFARDILAGTTTLRGESTSQAGWYEGLLFSDVVALLIRLGFGAGSLWGILLVSVSLSTAMVVFGAHRSLGPGAAVFSWPAWTSWILWTTEYPIAWNVAITAVPLGLATLGTLRHERTHALSDTFVAGTGIGIAMCGHIGLIAALPGFFLRTFMSPHRPWQSLATARGNFGGRVAPMIVELPRTEADWPQLFGAQPSEARGQSEIPSNRP